MKYNIKFNHKASSLHKAIKTSINMDDVAKYMREKLQNGEKQKTEALEDTLNKYDPQSPEDLLAVGVILGGLNGTEQLISHVRDADIPPGLMKEMFNSLLRRAFGSDSDINLSNMELNREGFKETMGDDKHDF
ncbi:MAG: hypothetical protein CMH62_01565 [Nanoarchaeota archaeon]|jgi:hypothetical protein|nr:hypothetical protein [Nanoarchaeota archaeon]|tara:strand:- start:7064 stop:7462 length:399 start_codon:yes stop_codon:yes gene_type:complete